MSRLPRLSLVLVTATGCRQLFGFEEAITGDARSPSAGDATTDGIPDIINAVCVGTTPMEVCFESEPTSDFVLSAGFDTASGCPEVVVMNGRQVCLVSARTISVQNQPRITGPHPLVLVGTQQVTIEQSAILDLSSSRTNNRRGAGSSGTECANSPAGGTSGGGAGGSFGGAGGDGGSGTQAGGNAPAPRALVFDGGCAGGALVSSFGGFGGGAVYVISQSVAINGTILATGGGGGGGLMGSGGAGGGSGGSIVIDSPILAINAQALLVATGGGGGSGSCSGAAGVPGQDADGEIIASGGNAPNTGGDGGEGGFDFSQAGNGAPGGNGCGGGGGGGGAGAIVFLSSTGCPTNQCFPPVGQ